LLHVPDAPDEFISQQVSAVCQSLNVDESAAGPASAALDGRVPTDAAIDSIVAQHFGQTGAEEFGAEEESRIWDDFVAGGGAAEGSTAPSRTYLFVEHNPHMEHAEPYVAGVEAYRSGQLNEVRLLPVPQSAG
jgi:hypothetical protein